MLVKKLSITEEGLVKKVVELGTKNSKTLGHFPEGAFLEHIKKGFLYVSLDKENELLGYILFSITQSKRIIRVIHLCINENHRGRGIAIQLLNTIKNSFYTKLRGISLSCREDYTVATRFWEKFGFKAINRKRSRSKQENFLVKWWYDFGSDDLFSNIIKETDSIKAVLDANIIIKKRDNFKDETGVKFLFADWLSDVDYFYAPEIFNEINRDENKERAQLTRKSLGYFTKITFKPNIRDVIFQEISEIILGNTVNDISDKLQVSECIASEIEYFITTDEKILNASDFIFDKYGVQSLRPTDFILYMDELNNKTNYYSSRLAGVRYNYKSIQSFQINKIVDTFLFKNRGEKKHDLRNKLTSLASNITNSKVMLVEDKKGFNIGLWGAIIEEEVFKVSIIRAIKSKLSSVLFKQLIYKIIFLSIEKNKHYLIINEKYLNEEQSEILNSFGFLFKNKKWVKLIQIGVVNSVEYFSDKNISDGYLNSEDVLNEFSKNNEFYKLKIERLLFPLKFSDLDIPTYIVPIKPYWAGQLFDYKIAGENLFGATPELSWNRENVYYRSVKPILEKAPARILWYVSKGDKDYSDRRSCIVGCSYLDEANIDKPKSLFQKFKYFGIYKWKDIYGLAKNDIENSIKALEFSDTEIFNNSISLQKVNKILTVNGRKKNTFASPLMINNDIFNQIYILGTKTK